MDLLLRRVMELGARLARPGEFSERAFVNDKLDLAQAEAIIDLIESGTAAGARLAVRTLEGVFSARIHLLVQGLIELRKYIESAIDFPEEEIDFLADGQICSQLEQLQSDYRKLTADTKTGIVMRDGLKLVIAGKPNAGKSSLLNALTGTQRAIVTDIPGTTRDVLNERMELDGIPLHIADTAGIRESNDQIEIEGVRRAQAELETADHILWIFDDSLGEEQDVENLDIPDNIPLSLVRNKIDISGAPAGIVERKRYTEISISAKEGTGMDGLKRHIRNKAGRTDEQQGEFTARRRHLDALQRAVDHMESAIETMQETRAGELVAEELRLAQNCLGEITGEFTTEELLGEIFSSFCIGK
jgi:tRNA modification GTPase